MSNNLSIYDVLLLIEAYDFIKENVHYQADPDTGKLYEMIKSPKLLEILKDRICHDFGDVEGERIFDIIEGFAVEIPEVIFNIYRGRLNGTLRCLNTKT